jgi:hypothetical protein
MTTVCDPGIGAFRAMEDEWEYSDYFDQRVSDLEEQIYCQHRLPNYLNMDERVCERVNDYLSSGRVMSDFIVSMWWAHGCAVPQQAHKELALKKLAEIAKEIDAIVTDEAKYQVEQDIADEREAAGEP